MVRRALADEGTDDAGEEEGLDAHIEQAGDRRRLVRVSVRRRDGPSWRRDGDFGGLEVAISRHDDIRSAEDGAEAIGEVRLISALTSIWETREAVFHRLLNVMMRRRRRDEERRSRAKWICPSGGAVTRMMHWAGRAVF